MLYIVQGVQVTQHRKAISDLLHTAPQDYSPAAVGFEVHGNEDALKDFCRKHQLDLAVMTERQPWSNIKLLAMDMDSTLINIECIDEIADLQGLKPQVSAITEAAMRGEIDFSESLRRRVALLKGLPIQALNTVLTQRLRLNPGAEALIQTAQRHGTTTLLVSGGFTFFTASLKQRLALDYAYANELEIQDERLTGKVLGEIVDGEKKAYFVASLKQQLECTDEQVIVIGDGANDLRMMSHSAFSIAYHAKPVVQDSARFAINFGGLDTVVNLFST